MVNIEFAANDPSCRYGIGLDEQQPEPERLAPVLHGDASAVAPRRHSDDVPDHLNRDFIDGARPMITPRPDMRLSPDGDYRFSSSGRMSFDRKWPARVDLAILLRLPDFVPASAFHRLSHRHAVLARRVKGHLSVQPDRQAPDSVASP